MKKLVNSSIVLYRNKTYEVIKIIEQVLDCDIISKLYIIDNSPTNRLSEIISDIRVSYHHFPSNPGFGSGHNFALKKSISQNVKYHLVLNSDIIFEKFTINKLVDFININSDVGHVMPKILNTDRSIQKVVKLLPTPMDLFGRAFLPNLLNKKRDSKYTLSDYKYDKVIETPNLSGCFMLLRTVALEEVGLFDERYFMYAEDIDLTRRINSKYKTIVYPYLEIIHRHEKASFKSLKMRFIHIVSIIKYFNKWGWIYDSERSRVNKKILSQF